MSPCIWSRRGGPIQLAANTNKIGVVTSKLRKGSVPKTAPAHSSHITAPGLPSSPSEGSLTFCHPRNCILPALRVGAYGALTFYRVLLPLQWPMAEVRGCTAAAHEDSMGLPAVPRYIRIGRVLGVGGGGSSSARGSSLALLCSAEKREVVPVQLNVLG